MRAEGTDPWRAVLDCRSRPSRGRLGPRPGRAPGPAGPGLAVRLGRFSGPDRLVRAALRRLDRGAAAARRTGARSPGSALERLSRAGDQVALRACSGSASGCSCSTRGWSGTDDPPLQLRGRLRLLTFWLGLVLLSVLFGDVFRAFNPWRAIGRVFSGAFRLVAGQSAPGPARVPGAPGRWPAAIGVLAFVWLELISGGGRALARVPHERRDRDGRLQRDHLRLHGPVRGGGVDPAGRGVLRSTSRCSPGSRPFEVRDGRLGLRKFLTGAPSWAAVPGAAALVLVSIAVTSFDGAQEGVSRGAIIVDLRTRGRPRLRSRATRSGSPTRSGCASSSRGVSVSTGSASGGCTPCAARRRSRELGRSFAHTLIPIALAYLVAHYFSAFVYQEQAQFTYILSDPLGEGSDLFGTAGVRDRLRLISSNTVWYVQVGGAGGRPRGRPDPRPRPRPRGLRRLARAPRARSTSCSR